MEGSTISDVTAATVPGDEAVTTERTVNIPANTNPVLVFGPGDEVLSAIIAAVPDVDVMVRGNQIQLRGPAGRVSIIAGFIGELVELARAGRPLSAHAAEHALSLLTNVSGSHDTRNGHPGGAGFSSGGNSEFAASWAGNKPVTLAGGDVRLDAQMLRAAGRKVLAKSPGQALYQRAIAENTVIFGIGPAGTGKTYLAMAAAVEALLTGQVKRIILTRPAVEAGENLGFLPGSLTEKIDPYLRPLYDALYDLMDPEAVPKLMAANTIEVAPLAYMRGRTLNDAFVVLDEAQNTTAQQMKMFLTRLGFNSKMVVTGDTSQVDLPGGVRSGLQQAETILEGIPDIAICRLTSSDVVRHQLVGEIIDAYDRYDAAHPLDNVRQRTGRNYARRTQ